MSASREKKERKEQYTQGIPMRQKQEQEALARQRTNRILYGIAGGILAVAIIALLVWNSGVFQRNSTALTVNGRKFGPADVSYFYYQAVNTAWNNEQYMVWYYEEVYGVEYSPFFDPSSDLRQQWMDEEKTQSMHDYFLETAKASLTQAVALDDAAKADGFVLPQESRDSMNQTFEDLKTQATSVYYSTDAYLKAVYGRHMTQAVYRRNQELAAIASAYYTAKTGEMGEYGDAEIQAYYAENPRYLDSYHYERCYIDGTVADPLDEYGDPLIDENGNVVTVSDEERAVALAVAKANAESMVAGVRGGSDFAGLAPLYVNENDSLAYSQAGYTTAFDMGSSLSGTLYGDWLTDPARVAGDVELFENGSSGLYVIQYQSQELDNNETVNFRHILFMAETDEDETVPTADQMNAARAKAVDALSEWRASAAPSAESFGLLADEVSEDGGSAGNGGLYSNVKRGDMVANINTWIFDSARQVGDTTLAENNGPGYYGWHVVYFAGTNPPDWLATATEEMKNAEITAWLESIESGYEGVEGAGMKHVS